LYNKNKFNPALKSFKASEKNDPIAKFTLAKIGSILAKQKKWTQALVYLERAYQLEYSSQEFLLDLAFVNRRSRKFNKAVEVYNKVDKEIFELPIYVISYANSLI
jgi:tetratricopeptide (TPR) repeat protein